MPTPTTFVANARLQSKGGICAYLGGISPATYDSWQARGIVPGPVRGTNRYDVKAHDLALDRCAGIAHKARSGSALEDFEESHAA